MKLWTVQSFYVYELMQKEGIYRCNPEKCNLLEYSGFTNAYKWIYNQMKEKIGNPPENTVFPVWAWYLYDGKNKRLDMRSSGLRVNEKSVLWEIEIPNTEVLLTDFDAWHIVLYDSLIYQANYKSITDEEWEKESQKEEEIYNNLTEEEKECYKRKSWEQIICTPETSIPYVQATFWELKASQIKKAWILKK